ncbi:MAG: ComEA family DNA-binding protein [Acholeplasma sp.]|jgi:competence protein ComEA|nr:MAG: ComEA family DNA-binding protein [Acholeplasma sp.]
MKQIYLIIIVIVGLGWLWFFPEQEEVTFVNQGPIDYDVIVIELKGEVVFPGVYHFFEPMTLKEILSYAGGLTEEADLSSLQLSETIDQDRNITILSKQPTPQTDIVKLNINQASFKELITIPGITETKAASIIIYRENYGDFHSLDELINVKYIGVATLEKIRPYLTVG